MSFAARSQALESRYIREQEALALSQRLGSTASLQGLPTTFASRPACEAMPLYVKGPQSCAPQSCCAAQLVPAKAMLTC